MFFQSSFFLQCDLVLLPQKNKEDYERVTKLITSLEEQEKGYVAFLADVLVSSNLNCIEPAKYHNASLVSAEHHF